MEPEQPPSEPSDDPKPPPTTTEQHQQTTTHTPRSYECNFCKRGFTNAQALGGHMNIHRKDKTKFKHSSNTAESPSTTTTAAADPFSIDGKKPLPVFDHRDTAVQRNIHRPSPEGDVDLELRLGHVEPPPDSSSENTTTTRKFF
ncbi:hypothetical protein L1987_41105 [Smallanthus sonchifolius]|uniref:Uncharacterized protein n=1 Tax=Smallanthus sonchifolius TaxID=185202 RepID=A0ACB9GUU0_9ASTR|nr:hypothetical protein L1987_41105 [Smallanthus sonchifolius]